MACQALVTEIPAYMTGVCRLREIGGMTSVTARVDQLVITPGMARLAINRDVRAGESKLCCRMIERRR
jgi:hypothetical protein